jgi:transcriptional regulator with XRE-family HTH domain
MRSKKPVVTDEAIGALVRERRRKIGMGQPELGEAIGVSEQMVQKYEVGGSPLTVVRLARIAEMLKCKIFGLIPKE